MTKTRAEKRLEAAKMMRSTSDAILKIKPEQWLAHHPVILSRICEALAVLLEELP